MLNNDTKPRDHQPEMPASCHSIDWYAEGEAKTIEVGNTRIIVRYLGRKGRRSRICIVAPAGTKFIAEIMT